ncbi:hypothetical protein GDO81_020334 [Engystomops pustulosus]|uniref:Uncharacterized protein n=1 Tax=Engystomops pustulosus TaxID=76066 RepID=A0AAV6YT03_ENGPU|nr:hypothetical protein GDO81_020334 [Engystomops pustulosus]
MRSQDPPIWDECGGLNTQVHLLLVKKFSNCSSLQAPTKLEPQSDLNCLTGPRMEKNLLRALMKQEVSMHSITSMCTARMLRQVNSTAHRLLFAAPPRVLRVTTGHGPKTSTPT